MDLASTWTRLREHLPADLLTPMQNSPSDILKMLVRPSQWRVAATDLQAIKLHSRRGNEFRFFSKVRSPGLRRLCSTWIQRHHSRFECKKPRLSPAVSPATCLWPHSLLIDAIALQAAPRYCERQWTRLKIADNLWSPSELADARERAACYARTGRPTSCNANEFDTNDTDIDCR